MLIVLVILTISLLTFVSALDVTITNPQNDETFNTTSIDLNVTSTSANISVWWYSLDNGIINITKEKTENETIVASEGSNIVNVWLNDTLGNNGSTSVTFTVDSIKITNPSNNPYYTNNGTNIEINYTLSDTNMQSSWYSINGIINITLQNYENITSNFSEGTNTLTIYTNDSAGNENSESRNIIVDATAPTVTLVSPQNSNTSYLQSNSVTVDFTFDVSETSISNCYWKLNGGDDTLNSSPITLTGNVISFTFTSENTYDSPGWIIKCLDLAGNEGVSEARTISIAQQSTTTTTTSGGTEATTSGGSRSSVIGTTYIVTKEQGEQGVTRNLKTDDKIKLEIELDSQLETHYIKMKNMTDNKADITIESDPIDRTLSIGNLEKFDLNDDDGYDLQIKLISIINKKAKLSIEIISEEVEAILLEEEVTEEIIEDTDKGNLITGMVTGVVNKVGKRNLTISSVFIAIIAASAIGFIFIRKKNPQTLDKIRKKFKRSKPDEHDIILKNAKKIKAKSKGEEKIPSISREEYKKYQEWQDNHQ